jgi:hypothetical protein
VCHIPSRKVQDVWVYSAEGESWVGVRVDKGIYDPGSKGNTTSCEAALAVVKPSQIREATESFDPDSLKSLPKLEHDGIDVDTSCGKVSVTKYFDGKRWRGLQGDD